MLRLLRKLIEVLRTMLRVEHRTHAAPPVEQHDAPAEAPPRPPALRIERDTLVGERVEHRRCHNTGGPFASVPSLVIIHYTGSTRAASALDTLTSEQPPRRSCHVVIDRNGDLYTLLPFTRVAWHAGISEWEGKTNLNHYSIGIELVNGGKLQIKGDGSITTYLGETIPDPDVNAVTRQGSLWHKYTDEQIAACTEVCKLLADHYPIRHILGHEQVSPGRKIDPGPAFPLDELRAAVAQSRRAA